MEFARQIICILLGTIYTVNVISSPVAGNYLIGICIMHYLKLFFADLSGELVWQPASKDNYSSIVGKVIGSVDAHGKGYYICRLVVKDLGHSPGYVSL